jgi:uncharacterized membrane protein (DUF2068 family)
MTDQTKSEKRLPRGVYGLASLMFLAGAALLLAAFVLPYMGTNLVPWFVYLGYGLYFVVVGYGLWSGKRWSYIATLFMCIVLTFYQFQTAIVLQQNALFQVILLAAIFIYMLQPQVRAAFLHSNSDHGKP